MGVNLLPYIQESNFVEAISFVSTVRFIWAQWLPSELEDHRGVLLIRFLIFKHELGKEALLHNIKLFSESKTSDVATALRNESDRRWLILRYNILSSGLPSFVWVPVLLMVIFIAYFKPILIVSIFLGDLITMRIHLHITRSFICSQLLTHTYCNGA
jgi:hypothetical protein